LNALRDAIYTQLASGTALTTALGGTAIYHLHAPEGAALPYVVFSWQGGGDLNIDPNETSETVQFIRAYAASDAAAGTIDGLVRARLHRQSVTVTGYNTVYCWREGDYETVETTAGTAIYTHGGFYRIRITK
jgi:hypothetical protein